MQNINKKKINRVGLITLEQVINYTNLPGSHCINLAMFSGSLIFTDRATKAYTQDIARLDNRKQSN
jgi:hypothetical protein